MVLPDQQVPQCSLRDLRQEYVDAMAVDAQDDEPDDDGEEDEGVIPVVPTGTSSRNKTYGFTCQGFPYRHSAVQSHFDQSPEQKDCLCSLSHK